ncbi:MAG: DNA polymerase III subunit gamma/tau [Chlamydiota bacterium]
MSEYQVIARRYRPQKFCDVVAQDAIVTTLKNAIKHERLAHAYLFCGSRGTGKTTLARIFAKALNCPNMTHDFEPCGECSSCKEIAHGSSLDVLEIDGASHRGIDDIRQINETVGYTTSSGGYKIFIIDEVHMLTKEAFNALLKTLEEPPEKVKFFFATTEPHKVLPTILSRCQRFNLNRIPTDKIIEKLKEISLDLHVNADQEALRMIAQRADGGLRDAESLLDQIFSFHGDHITTETVASVLGIMSRDTLFEMDTAGKEGRLTVAFDIAHQVFAQGKDLVHFVETLTEHFRNLLLIKLSGPNAAGLSLSENDRQRYQQSANIYTQEQCMNILEYLVDAQNQIRFAPSGRVALESILLHVMRTHRRIPIEVLVRRLAELEQSLSVPSSTQNINQSEHITLTETSHKPAVNQPPTIKTDPTPTPRKAPTPQQVERKQTEATNAVPPPQPTNIQVDQQQSFTTDSSPTPQQVEPKQTEVAKTAPTPPLTNTQAPKQQSVTIDPTPAPKDIPPKRAENKPKISVKQAKPKKFEVDSGKLLDQHHYDTIMQFAAVELEGKLEKKQIKRT